jgi:transcription antitermination factor NusG
MGSVGQVATYNFEGGALAQPQWYALYTHARHEKRVAEELTGKGVDNYLPLVSRIHRWSDRKKQVELPLFSCYVFARLAGSIEERLRVLQTNGVLGFVGAGRQGVVIPDSEIEYLQTILLNKIAVDSYPFLTVGKRVRVCGGSLDGLEGILMEKIGNRRLVISITGIERSLSMCIEGLQVEEA